MPVRWTPENDRLLLITILNTHEISVDHKKVADSWRSDEKEKPTPRAISERLHKIRSLMKSEKGSAPSTPASATAKGRVSKTTPKTPTPRRKRASTQGSSLKKEKPEAEDTDDMDVDTPSKKPVVKAEPGFKVEIESPKRERKPAVYHGMVGYPSDPEDGGEVKVDDEGHGETSASDFVPDDSFDSGSVETGYRVEG